MNRFYKSKKDFSIVKDVFLPLVIFIAIFVSFNFGLTSIFNAANEQQYIATKEAIMRSAVHCYALEGAYPPNIEYLEQHYGLLINYKKFAVDYKCFASNMMPDVTVILL